MLDRRDDRLVVVKAIALKASEVIVAAELRLQVEGDDLATFVLGSDLGADPERNNAILVEVRNVLLDLEHHLREVESVETYVLVLAKRRRVESAGARPPREVAVVDFDEAAPARVPSVHAEARRIVRCEYFLERRNAAPFARSRMDVQDSNRSADAEPIADVVSDSKIGGEILVQIARKILEA